jgi:exonuclease VII small subunit
MSKMTGDEPSDDYLSAAAGVVDAARNLDEARQEFKRANEVVLEAHRKQTEAEKALRKALDKLKGADTGRK